MVEKNTPRLTVIRFTRDQFMTRTPPERELLIRVGLALNELLLAQRFWGALYYRGDPRSDGTQAAHAVQITSALLGLIGKLFEAIDIFDKFFLSSPVGNEYRLLFDDRQRAAVDELNGIRGRGGMLATIRNSFLFHFQANDREPERRAVFMLPCRPRLCANPK